MEGKPERKDSASDDYKKVMPGRWAELQLGKGRGGSRKDGGEDSLEDMVARFKLALSEWKTAVVMAFPSPDAFARLNRTHTRTRHGRRRMCKPGKRHPRRRAATASAPEELERAASGGARNVDGDDGRRRRRLPARR